MTRKTNLWTAREAMQATDGKTSGAWVASGVSIDSRTVEEGDLFIAIEGPQADGHDYVSHALQNGAVAAVVHKIPDGFSADDPRLLVVTDTMDAMEDLGQAARYRMGGKVVAVTGSVGKTSTKAMLAEAFKANGRMHCSVGSYNNHWGVPLTLSRMHDASDYGIFEIGMNHSGEIVPLTKQVRPDIAIITTVEAVHIEHFDSVQAIADAKAEIFEGVQTGGTVVLNRDNEWFSHLKRKAENLGLQVKSFGKHAEADARLVDVLVASNGTRVQADIDGETVSFMMPVIGEHHAMNAMAVLMAVALSGASLAKAVNGLTTMEAVEGRGKRELLQNIGGADNPVTVLDESYNASPASMRAAFKVLAMIDPGRGGRRIAILGDMLELGKEAAKAHKDLALPLQAAGVQLVYTCGTLMKNLYDSIPKEQQGAHATTSQELAQIVPDVLVPGDVVMVKGSNGSKMGSVIEAMRALPSVSA